MNIWLHLLYSLISAFTFRVRGGLFERQWRRLPLNKWWFAVWFPVMHCLVRGWNLPFFATGLIASKMCTSIAGWGSYIGALLFGIINKLDKDDLNITDFVQTKAFKYLYKVTVWCSQHRGFKWVVKLLRLTSDCYEDHPKLYGWICLSLRGGLTTFILGLWLNEPWFMPIGLLQGTVYWLGGQTCKHIIDDGKGGWNISEWYWGFVLGFFSLLFGPSY